MFSVLGLTPSTNEDEDMSMMESECSQSRADDMTLGGDSFVSNNTFVEKAHVKKHKFTSMNMTINKEAIIDVWQDSSPRYRCSIQFQLETEQHAK